MGGYARNDSYIYSFSVITVGSLTNVRDDRVIKGGKGGAAICIGKLPPLPTTLYLLCHSESRVSEARNPISLLLHALALSLVILNPSIPERGISYIQLIISLLCTFFPGQLQQRRNLVYPTDKRSEESCIPD